MKKNLLAVVLCTTLSLSFTACSSDDSQATALEQVTFEQLPTTTQEFVATTFPDARVLRASKIVKSNYYGSYYALILDNNIEIDFDQAGHWTEIETEDDTALPEAFLTQEVPLIHTYVKTQYKGSYIVEIDRDRRGYEVSLNTGLSLIFNAEQAFVGIDMDLDENEQYSTYAQLPAAVQSFLKTYFPTVEVVLIKQETEVKTTTYKIYTHDGFTIEVDQEGVWLEIETKQNQAIPIALIPDLITNYIQTYYRDFKHTGIEKDKKGYEVEVKKGNQEIELHFDLDGNFIRVDA